MSFTMAEEESTTQQAVVPVSMDQNTPYYRLGMPDIDRIAALSLVSFAGGAILGASRAGTMEALRFRAENAHRLPKSTKGWYLYHKSKNYAVMFSGIKAGLKTGSKFAFWIGLASAIETVVDKKHNKHKDFRSTAVVGALSGFAWGRWHHMSAPASRRMFWLGFKAGLGYGLLQDVIGWLGGHRFEYMHLPKAMVSRLET